MRASVTVTVTGELSLVDLAMPRELWGEGFAQGSARFKMFPNHPAWLSVWALAPSGIEGAIITAGVSGGGVAIVCTRLAGTVVELGMFSGPAGGETNTPLDYEVRTNPGGFENLVEISGIGSTVNAAVTARDTDQGTATIAALLPGTYAVLAVLTIAPVHSKTIVLAASASVTSAGLTAPSFAPGETAPKLATA